MDKQNVASIYNQMNKIKKGKITYIYTKKKKRFGCLLEDVVLTQQIERQDDDGQENGLFLGWPKSSFCSIGKDIFQKRKCVSAEKFNFC